MTNDMMDLEELAVYLRRDPREVSKLVSRGQLPGQKVAGQWRFAKAEINHWLEGQMPGYDDTQLSALESQHGAAADEPLVASLLSKDCMAVPLPASTKASVLRELVKLAEQSWQVYDPEAILEAVKHREEMATTALPGGVALPHPHRPLPNLLGESVLAFGRTASGIPFGGERGQLTDLFFLVCCRDERTHLRVLARLARLFLRPGFLDELRDADTAAMAWQLIHDTEQALT